MSTATIARRKGLSIGPSHADLKEAAASVQRARAELSDLMAALDGAVEPELIGYALVLNVELTIAKNALASALAGAA
jgi:hypothetical protein